MDSLKLSKYQFILLICYFIYFLIYNLIESGLNIAFSLGAGFGTITVIYFFMVIFNLIVNKIHTKNKILKNTYGIFRIIFVSLAILSVGFVFFLFMTIT